MGARRGGSPPRRRSRSPMRRRSRSPVRRRSPPGRDNDRRRRSRSPMKRRSRTRSPTPEPKRISVTKLTRNITKEHILEIFGSFGAVQSVEIPGGSGLSFTFRHCCFVEYEQTADAAKALKYMDGGQIMDKKLW